MDEHCPEFKKFLSLKDPSQHGDLNSPAENHEIKKLEKIINASLPVTFVKCLQMHNGQKGNAGGIFRGHQFLSCEQIATEWSIWKQLHDNNEFVNQTAKPDQGISQIWWHPMWIPFTSDGSGNHFCIDLAPTKDGKKGQIISFFHDDPSRVKQANSFSEWLAAQK